MIRRAVYDLKSPTSFARSLAEAMKWMMVLKDDISEKHDATLILKKLPGIEHDLYGLGPREHG